MRRNLKNICDLIGRHRVFNSERKIQRKTDSKFYENLTANNNYHTVLNVIAYSFQQDNTIQPEHCCYSTELWETRPKIRPWGKEECP